jgi:1,4-alpha-glucan branching enzyme
LIKTTKPGRDGTVRVTFTLPADEPAGSVSVVGNFNDWNPFAHPLRRRANRTRSTAVTVPAGSTLHFRYLAEGGVWFDEATISAHEGQDRTITVLAACKFAVAASYHRSFGRRKESYHPERPVVLRPGDHGRGTTAGGPECPEGQTGRVAASGRLPRAAGCTSLVGAT